MEPQYCAKLKSLCYNLANRSYLRGIELGSDVVAPLLLFSMLLSAVWQLQQQGEGRRGCPRLPGRPALGQTLWDEKAGRRPWIGDRCKLTIRWLKGWSKEDGSPFTGVREQDTSIRSKERPLKSTSLWLCTACLCHSCWKVEGWGEKLGW